MNRSDQSLKKLLDAASRAQRELPESPPFAIEAAIIAQLRHPHQEDDLASLLRLFRHATIVAAVVVMLSGAWSFLGDTSNTGATALASYAMMQLPP